MVFKRLTLPDCVVGKCRECVLGTQGRLRGKRRFNSLWVAACVFSIRDGYLILNLCKSACRRSHQLKKVAKFVAPSVVYENRSCCCAAHGVQSAFSQINSSPPPLELGAKAQAPTHLLLHTRINKFKWRMNRTANFTNLFFSPAPPRRVASPSQQNTLSAKSVKNKLSVQHFSGRVIFWAWCSISLAKGAQLTALEYFWSEFCGKTHWIYK